ncbi:MAG: flagellar export chaperone FliS [Gammaproteobacteria bacterium]|nr:flagellar export chaperone FliS [Gammaproteobacteria bacterium]
MGAFNQATPLSAYQEVGKSDLAYADPHRLISMLMDGALDRIARARHAMQVGQVAKKGELISNAITIITGLKGCLNMEASEALSANLADLYDYMCRRLVQANAQDDDSLLDEVSSLLGEIRFAWDAIPESAKRTGDGNAPQPAQNANPVD